MMATMPDATMVFESLRRRMKTQPISCPFKGIDGDRSARDRLFSVERENAAYNDAGPALVRGPQP